jgi:hypothetical protein
MIAESINRLADATASSERPLLPPLPPVPHVHRWVAVGIIYVPNGDRGLLGETIPAVAQSCYCGAVQAVVIAGALR